MAAVRAMFHLYKLWIVLFAVVLPFMPAHAGGSGTSGDPYTALADAYSAPASGRYFFNLGSGTFEADVDTSEGGGWVLVVQYVHAGGTNPPLSVIGAGSNLPILSTAVIQDQADESSDLTRWGHAGNAAMSQFTGNIETRWYAATSAHSRVIHFRTIVGRDYLRTGLGSMGGVNASFTSLSGATAGLPATATNVFGNQGDYAFTNFPFWRGGVSHWGIKGDPSGSNPTDGFRWEVDDFTNNGANSTIHRVWVRTEAPLVVTNTNDSGEGSLRQAMLVANSNALLDSISFDIPGTGPHTITLASALPTITDDGVVLDATTQPGAACGDLWGGTPHTLLVRINTGNFRALGITGSNVTIRGLSITGTGNSNGIEIGGAANGTAIQCNYVGLTPDGSAQGMSDGVRTGGAGTVIGGLTPGDGNVISSNRVGVITTNGSSATAFRGNFIGTDPSGTAARPNAVRSINHQNGSGTWSDITRNLISGNGNAGIRTDADDSITPSGATVSIIGNYIGVDRTGNAPLGNNDSGILFDSGSISNVTIGGTGPNDRNIIGGNRFAAIVMVGSRDVTILGNNLGLGADDTTLVGNVNEGIFGTGDLTNLRIGNGTVAGRNIITANGSRGISLRGANLNNAVIDGNYIGTDITGNFPVTSGRADVVNGDAISIDNNSSGTNVTISNNIVGGYAGGLLEFVNATITDLTIQGNRLGIGADGASNIARSDMLEPVLFFIGSGTITNATIGGTGTGQGNLIGNGAFEGILVNRVNSSFTFSGNTIRNNNGAGIAVLNDNSSVISIYANSIFSNGGLGIDLGALGVTPNDAGDGDTGPNNLLNFPVFDALNVAAGGDLSYTFTLDAPQETQGYRIDFYRNSQADPSNFGEGETWLGFIETGNHGGGEVAYTGTFTPLASVAIGEFVSATATRRTGSGLAETSEFNQNATIVTPLIVTNTNDGGAGSLRNAILFANNEADEDNITFNIPGSGVQTITLTSVLPPITDDGIFIDGSTQPGAACGDLWAGNPHRLRIRLDGGGSVGIGLNINGPNISVRGFSLTNFTDGVRASPSASNTVVQCSHIGLSADGAAIGGNTIGISNFGAGLLVGGLNPDEGNVVSGNSQIAIVSQNNSSALSIQGNFIGTDSTGSQARPNGSFTISNNSGSSTWSDITRNLISGNGGHGIDLQGDDQVRPSGSRITIAGNYIGTNRTGTAALANGGSGINFALGTISNLTIGGTGPNDRNIISGNGGDGITLGAQSGTNILGNYIGLNATGTSGIGNTGNGIALSGSSAIQIGDGTAGGRNVIAGNSARTIFGTGAIANIIVNGNYLGTDATGNKALSNGASLVIAIRDAVAFNSITSTGNLSILDNVIGGYEGAQIEIVNGSATNVSITGNSIGVGANGTSQIVNSPGEPLIHIEGSPADFSNVNIGGTGAGEGNVLAFSGSDAIFFVSNGSNARIVGNTIRNNARAGVLIPGGSAPVSIYQNSIFSNGGIGIDLGTGGVTPNDAGDGDTGPNNLLNFPVFDAVNVAAGGGLSYRFNLDAPAEANGYRIDFYRNSAADPTGFGEGEVWLGSIDTPAHPGGSVEYTGTLTPLAEVAAGNFVSATTTRKTGASTYGETSEFNQNATIVTPLVVTNTADSGAGSLRNAITFANSEPAQDAITFNIPGSGVQVITVASALPDLVDTGITIDGSTQAGASCGDLWAGTPPVLTVRIDGVSRSFTGLAPTAADQLIKGLSITGFANGIVTRAASSNARVQCNFIGLAPDGTASANDVGVIVFGGNAVIGGLNAGEGNVVSGNNPTGIVSGNGATAMAVRGNFIGTDPLGLTARANTEFPLSNSNGTASWSDITRNLISGNGGAGIGIQGNDVINPSAGTITIAGNYIGVNRAGTAALANGGSGIDFSVGTISNLTIGGTGPNDRNIISGNQGSGLLLDNFSNITILGNYIGLGLDGITDIGNRDEGISGKGNLTNLRIGDGTAAGRNIISGNNRSGILLTDGVFNNLVIDDNYIGTNVDGTLAVSNNIDGAFIGITNQAMIHNNVLSGNGNLGIRLEAGDDITVQNNYIGTNASGSAALANNNTGLFVSAAPNSNGYTNLVIQDNIISGNGRWGIDISSGVSGTLGEIADITVRRNIIGVGADNVSPIPNSFGGVKNSNVPGTIIIGGLSNVDGNVITKNDGPGILVNGVVGSNASILSNSIYDNSSIGIDLGPRGVNANDPGDGDSGANNFLNYPVLRAVSVAGGNVAYSLDLDVPNEGNGYRIDFYKSSSVDASGNGEGEIWLGAVETPTHPGGTVNYTGSFAPAASVADGDNISATATRKTATGFAETSEFSVTVTGGTPDITVALNSTVYDPSSEGLFAVPGNDMIYDLTVTNTGGVASDPDSLTLVTAIPSNVTFYNGTTAEFGGQVIGFDAGASGMTFDPANDVGYSNSATRPTDFNQCTYSPTSGYDEAVTFVCFNPKGSMSASGDPSVQLRYRVQIK